MKSMQSAALPQSETIPSFTAGSILRAQSLLAHRYGGRCADGAGSLEITPRGVSLTNSRHRIVADTPEAIAELLGVSAAPADRSAAVTLDPLASKLVHWYAEENGREIADVVNGLVSGELGHLRNEIEGGFTDDSPMHIAAYVGLAAHRRLVRELKGRA